MTPEVLKVGAALIGVIGLLICFAGHRLFRVFLAAAGFVVGVWLGRTMIHALRLEGLLAQILPWGLGLGLAYLAAAVYYVGVFASGGMAAAGLAFLVSVKVHHPVPPTALLVVFAVAGAITLVAHRTLVIHLTAISGALLAVLGAAPLVAGVPPPTSADPGWIPAALGALPVWWLLVGLGLAASGSVVQRWIQPRRRHVVAVDAYDELPPDPEPPRRTQRRMGGSHGVTCPRCGAFVDPGASSCFSCGNDLWD
jgi:hypothetical protein